MTPKEFLEKIEVELKISKNSSYTTQNYLKANEKFLSFIKKQPEEATEDDVKKYIAERLSEHSSSTIILFLSAIK